MDMHLRDAFIIHICKYLGIALVSGSIVHAGTLGGSTMKYVSLIGVGILLTVVGHYLENKASHKAIDAQFVALAVALSFGTGMLSGGVQHYLDNPAYGAVLLSLGLVLTFLALGYKDFKRTLTARSVGIVCATSVVLFIGTYTILPQFLPADSHSHEEESGQHVD
jgi:hypothetical protein